MYRIGVAISMCLTFFHVLRVGKFGQFFTVQMADVDEKLHAVLHNDLHNKELTDAS